MQTNFTPTNSKTRYREADLLTPPPESKRHKEEEAFSPQSSKLSISSTFFADNALFDWPVSPPPIDIPTFPPPDDSSFLFLTLPSIDATTATEVHPAAAVPLLQGARPVALPGLPYTAKGFYNAVQAKLYPYAKQMLHQFQGPKRELLNYVLPNGTTALSHIFNYTDKDAHLLAEYILLKHGDDIPDEIINANECSKGENDGSRGTSALMLAICRYNSLEKNLGASKAEDILKVLISRSTLSSLKLKWTSKTAYNLAEDRKLVHIMDGIERKIETLQGRRRVVLRFADRLAALLPKKVFE